MWRVLQEPVNFRFAQTMIFVGKTPFLDCFGLLNVVKPTGRKAIILAKVPPISRFRSELSEIRKRMSTILRSGAMGTGIGALPGVGEDVAGRVFYGVGKMSSKGNKQFGHGSRDGLISADAANDAAIGGALIPLLVLGIPGSPPAAALLGALKINNVIPGPTIDPVIITHIAAILVLSSLTMLLMGLFTARVFTTILQIPNRLPPDCHGVDHDRLLLSRCGINDLFLMIGVGLVAYAMNVMHYPIAPLVIGVILGGLLDETFRRSLLQSDGDLTAFVSRPGAGILIAFNVLPILSQFPAVKRLFNRLIGRT